MSDQYDDAAREWLNQYWPNQDKFDIEDADVRMLAALLRTRVKPVEAERDRQRGAAEKYYAEAERLRLQLEEERACHDCREFRALAEQENVKLRAELDLVRRVARIE